MSQALHIEGTLDLLLAQYFCAEDHAKINFFTDKLLTKADYGLNFYQKKRLLSAICENENVDIKELKKTLAFIIKTRNKVAHYQRFWGGDDTILYPRKSVVDTNNEGLELTDGFMQELESKSKSANMELAKLFSEINKKK